MNCKVVELKSFTKTAEASQMSQPSVNEHLCTLKEEPSRPLPNTTAP